MKEDDFTYPIPEWALSSFSLDPYEKNQGAYGGYQGTMSSTTPQGGIL